MRYDKEKTLFVTDLDGTLLDKNAELTSYTRDVLVNLISEGYAFTIATGRRWRSVQRVGFENHSIDFKLPVILMNGVVTYDTAKRENIKIYGLPDGSAQQIMSVADKHCVDLLAYAASKDGNDVISYLVKAGNGYLTAKPHRVDVLSADVACGDIAYFLLGGAYDELCPIHDAAAALPGIACIFGRDVYSSDGWFAEFFSEKASKGAGIRFLREKHGFSHVVGFGDNINDLALFAECDEAYAPENAIPEVKAAAAGIIAENSCDSVARWLEENVLNQG